MFFALNQNRIEFADLSLVTSAATAATRHRLILILKALYRRSTRLIRLDRRNQAVMGIVCLGIITLVVLSWPEREPQNKGKTLSQWLADVDSPSYFSRTNPDEVEFLSPAAREALIGMGTNTLPHLVRMLTRQDSALKLKVLALAKKQSWVPIKVVPASEHRSRALKALEILGPIAEPVVPDLINLMQSSDENLSHTAVSAMEIFDPASRRQWLPALTALAKHETPHVRKGAIQLLAPL